MATRSRIAIKLEDKILSIYCHYDGYPEGVGNTLKQHYQDPAKIQSLMDLGNLSILRPEIGEKQDFNDYASQNREWCLAYGRDRGEKDTEARMFSTTEKLVEYTKNSDQEYLYLYDNGWKYLDLYQVFKSEWQIL
jgi:hypothetical protein